MVKRSVKFAIVEGIALQLHHSWPTVGNVGFTTGRIAYTGRLDRTGYQIRQDGTCDIGLKYDGRRVRAMEMGLLAWGRLRWRSVDHEGNRDQQGDRDCDRRSGMQSRSGWCGPQKAITTGMVCATPCVGVDRKKRSRSEECVPHNVTCDQ